MFSENQLFFVVEEGSANRKSDAVQNSVRRLLVRL